MMLGIFGSAVFALFGFFWGGSGFARFPHGTISGPAERYPHGNFHCSCWRRLLNSKMAGSLNPKGLNRDVLIHACCHVDWRSLMVQPVFALSVCCPKFKQLVLVQS